MKTDCAVGDVGWVKVDPSVLRRGDSGTGTTEMSFCVKNCCGAGGCGTDKLVFDAGGLGVLHFTFVGSGGPIMVPSVGAR